MNPFTSAEKFYLVALGLGLTAMTIIRVTESVCNAKVVCAKAKN